MAWGGRWEANVQLVNNIIDIFCKLGPLLNQAMGAHTFERSHAAWNCKDLPALLSSESGGYKTPALLSGFHNNGPQCQPTNDPVPDRKVVSVRWGKEGKLGNNCPAFCNPVE